MVTYPDGSTDEVAVQIYVNSDAERYEPIGEQITVNKDDVPNAADAISIKMSCPKARLIIRSGLDTSEPGDKAGHIVVTYPDGTKDELYVIVEVIENSVSNAEEYEPDLQIIVVDKGAEPDPKMPSAISMIA